MELPEEVRQHYAEGFEQDRLDLDGRGKLEELRTQELLQRWLPKPPGVVLDVGGAAGRYALPLAEAGYTVHLLDPVPRHLQQAGDATRAAAKPLASVQQGDARELPFADLSADVVLLLGPLYHLPDREDRLLALREAKRVLRPGGLVVAAAISRWASAMDGLVAGFIRDTEFMRILAEDLATGVHRNPSNRPHWFTTAYFHRPEDLQGELEAVGFAADGPVAVEGLAHLAPDLDLLMADPATRPRVLHIVRATEREPALLGASSHLLIAGRKASA